MSDLRAKIADAARSVPIRLGPNSIANAQAGHALRLSGGEADQVADAVMGVIEAEHGGPKCMSADIYDQVCGQMHDAREEAQAAKGRVRELEAERDEDAGVIRALRRQRDTAEDRVRDLEKENQKLRDTAAVTRYVADHWREAAASNGWTVASHPLCLVLAALAGETEPEQLGLAEEDRAALGWAREIAKEAELP